jgi:hypothetical protein
MTTFFELWNTQYPGITEAYKPCNLIFSSSIRAFCLEITNYEPKMAVIKAKFPPCLKPHVCVF